MWYRNNEQRNESKQFGVRERKQTNALVIKAAYIGNEEAFLELWEEEGAKKYGVEKRGTSNSVKVKWLKKRERIWRAYGKRRILVQQYQRLEEIMASDIAPDYSDRSHICAIANLTEACE